MPYGFIELPENLESILNQDIQDVEATEKLGDKLKNGFNKAKTSVKNAIQNPTQTIKNLATSITPANITKIGSTLSNTITDVTTKYSGIALSQLLIDGKITCKSAADYLFLGLAPALNQAGIALGYGGIEQLKNAMLNGSLNVGQFVSGLSKICKGIYEEAKINNLLKENDNFEDRCIYFDMTTSDSSNMQSETPDRRVEEGNDLSEICHNMPIIYDIQCELQDNKRYSKAEFRRIFRELRDKKTMVTLYLGDEHFNNVILQNFSPSGQGSQKGGYEYNLQFKEITPGSIEEIEIVAFANAPTRKADEVSPSVKAISSNNNIKSGTTRPNTQKGKNANVKQSAPKNGASELFKIGNKIYQANYKEKMTYIIKD